MGFFSEIAGGLTSSSPFPLSRRAKREEGEDVKAPFDTPRFLFSVSFQWGEVKRGGAAYDSSMRKISASIDLTEDASGQVSPMTLSP